MFTIVVRVIHRMRSNIRISPEIINSFLVFGSADRQTRVSDELPTISDYKKKKSLTVASCAVQ